MKYTVQHQLWAGMQNPGLLCKGRYFSDMDIAILQGEKREKVVCHDATVCNQKKVSSRFLVEDELFSEQQPGFGV